MTETMEVQTPEVQDEATQAPEDLLPWTEPEPGKHFFNDGFFGVLVEPDPDTGNGYAVVAGVLGVPMVGVHTETLEDGKALAASLYMDFVVTVVTEGPKLAAALAEAPEEEPTEDDLS